MILLAPDTRVSLTRPELVRFATRYAQMSAARPGCHPYQELGLPDPYEWSATPHQANDAFMRSLDELPPGNLDEVRGHCDRRARAYNTRAILSAMAGVWGGGSAMLGGVALACLRSAWSGLALAGAGVGVILLGVWGYQRADGQETRYRGMEQQLTRWEDSVAAFTEACIGVRPKPDPAAVIGEAPDHVTVGGVRMVRRQKREPLD